MKFGLVVDITNEDTTIIAIENCVKLNNLQSGDTTVKLSMAVQTLLSFLDQFYHGI